MATPTQAASARKKPEKAPKPVFRLGDPYSAAKWPRISAEAQNTMLEMLCACVAPLGHYRASTVQSSRGKASSRRKRRRRAETAKLPERAMSGDEPAARPAPPAIQDHVTIGLNSTTRHLQSLAAKSTPKSLAALSASPPQSASRQAPRHMAVVFVSDTRSRLLYAHLPLLSLTASAANPSLPKTRLVKLGPDADRKIAAAAGVARVGVLGLLDGCAQTQATVDHVRGTVKPVRVPWLKEATDARYMSLNMEPAEPMEAEGNGSDGESGADVDMEEAADR